jgi:hypothetical protein
MVVSGFEPGDFSCDVYTPDSVISAVDRLIEFVRSRQGESENGVTAEGDAAGGGADNARIAFAAQLVDDLVFIVRISVPDGVKSGCVDLFP